MATSTYTVKAQYGRFIIDNSSFLAIFIPDGGSIIFDQSDASNTGHPIKISTTKDGTHAGGSEYTTGVVVTGTAGSAGAKVQFTPETDGIYYYYCGHHPNMGSSISFIKTVFTDLGATAYDADEGNLTTSIKKEVYKGSDLLATITSPHVNPWEVANISLPPTATENASYTIKYNVTDASSAVAQEYIRNININITTSPGDDFEPGDKAQYYIDSCQETPDLQGNLLPSAPLHEHVVTVYSPDYSDRYDSGITFFLVHEASLYPEALWDFLNQSGTYIESTTMDNPDPEIPQVSIKSTKYRIINGSTVWDFGAPRYSVAGNITAGEYCLSIPFADLQSSIGVSAHGLRQQIFNGGSWNASAGTYTIDSVLHTKTYEISWNTVDEYYTKGVFRNQMDNNGFMWNLPKTNLGQSGFIHNLYFGNEEPPAYMGHAFVSWANSSPMTYRCAPLCPDKDEFFAATGTGVGISNVVSVKGSWDDFDVTYPAGMETYTNDFKSYAGQNYKTWSLPIIGKFWHQTSSYPIPVYEERDISSGQTVGLRYLPPYFM